MKYFWRLYYLFNEPITKSELIMHHARINNIKIVNLKIGKLDASDFHGLPKYK